MTVALPLTSLPVATRPSMMSKDMVQQHYHDAAPVASSSRTIYDATLDYGNQSTSAARNACQWEASTSQLPPSGPSVESASSSNANLSVSAIPPQKQQAMWSPKRRRSSAPPKNSTDALAKWFAELISWIWFSPSSSTLVGASRPMTPVRSPTAAFAPHQPSPLATAGKRTGPTSSSVSGDDRFAMLGGTSVSAPSTAVWQSADTDHQLRRGTGASSGWTNGSFDDCSSPDRRFHPQEKFVAFIRDTIKTTQVSTSVLILALLYVQRLKLQHPKLRGQEGSEYRLSVTAMMLGNKFLDDHTYTNKTWSDISGIPLKDITKMEVEFWLGLQMRIYVHQDDYEAWLQTIDDLFTQRTQALWKREQRESARRKAAAQQLSPKPYPPLRYSFSQLGFCPSSESHLPSQQSLPQAWSPSHPFPPVNQEGGGATSPSPLSQYSTYSSAPTASSAASTCATSTLPMAGDNVFAYSPEQRRMSARKLSPLSTGSRSGYGSLSSTTAPSSMPAMTGWQHSTHLGAPRLSSGGNSGSSSIDSSANSLSRKRGREDQLETGDEANNINGRESKRAGLTPSAEAPSLDGYPCRSYSRASSAGAFGAEQLPQTTHAGSDYLASRNDSVGAPFPDDALYRSIFAEPLTPNCLTQGYVGPHGLPAGFQGSGDDRGLAFYQLAAGKDLGLPALHLPPPVSYFGGSNGAPWSTGGNNAAANAATAAAASAARRGSLNLAAFASPRGSWQTNAGHQSGSLSMSHSPSRQALPIRPLRLSPEAYGFSYGSSASTSGPSSQLASAVQPTSAPLTTGGINQNAASTEGDNRSRWMPFNNVPMNMQLEQMQQWHQIQYQQQMRAQEEEERRRRSSLGGLFAAGRY
ncbi:hypothetical protein BCV69DRAFT_141137 [Microstroma glucosiphilum]|uniref:Cyclin-domain-containing protein n=1 Tax=Pseudomicrostroma glucosiphilum TaxID=1684307 RepID=A0A316UBV5_9BASI|nr:hypothetical protein BCV69DRAFT_141137 [Pseudomicrostroma glucosiphilum]PWN22338.1 hypothetical protein BCV69DRAFT_141137 [Pseudomicrostroma glucosiphilum]